MVKWSKIKEFTKIPRSRFLEILKFCLMENNYFIYDTKVYNQIFGMPMGNPLSPTIADIVLDTLLDDVMTELDKRKIYIRYITKYVDDILAVIKIDDKDEILKTLNSYHQKIQFTVEVEKDSEIAYLDTKLKRNANRINFDWYTKETASGRIMNFNSTQPRSQILNTAQNFIDRILKISDKQFYTKNIEKIFKILVENSFPNRIIKTLIENSNRRLKNNNQGGNIANTEEKGKFYSVKYIPGLTDNRSIKQTMETKVNLAYKPNKTLNTIFTKVKAPIEKDQQNNIVYEIKCKGNIEENCDMIYIGTTKRALSTRMGEHKMDITRGKEATGLAQHLIKSTHTADFENVKILDFEKLERKRYIKESLRIQKNIRKTMNVKEDTNNINASYIVAIN